MKLVSIPANPVPAGAVMGVLKTPDGVSIRFARWPPPSDRKGTVCIFQGRIEFIEKYFEIVRDLNARGFAVATLDWRGQGLSDRMLRERRKGHVANFAQYDIDLETFMRDVVLPDCPPPLFALANSMGGAVRSDDQARQHSAACGGPDAGKDDADGWSRRHIHPGRRTGVQRLRPIPR